MASLEGRTLDRYELHELTGRGGMADVYLGYDPLFERSIAVKVFKREDEELLRRFIREARLMASLHNSYLMPVYDAGEIELDGVPRYYIVMPFMDGGTLRARIRRSPLSPEEACRYLHEIADALDYIHAQGIIHRDIKSSNVLLNEDGDCYLADFGIARTLTDATQLTSTGNVLGTVDYVAPELFEGNFKANERSDLYSLGVLLFEMVTGELPFKAESQIAVVSMHVSKPPPAPHTIVPSISSQVEHVVFKALEKKPEARYGSALELADAFCRAAHSRIDELKTFEAAAPAYEHIERPYDIADASAYVASAPAQASPPRAPTTPIPPMPPARSAGAYAATNRQVPPYLPASPMAPQVPQIPQRSSAARTRTRILTIIALCALLAVTIPVALVFLVYRHGGGASATATLGQTPAATITTGNATATATATASSPTPTPTPNYTATAQIAAATATQTAKNATATAIAGVTATAQAQASATAGVIQTATSGTPSYSDALNDPNNPATQAANWDQTSNCTFESDGYHVTEGVNLINFHGCLESGKTYSNATISVDMSVLGGHSGGLFFNVSTNIVGAYSGYLFEVDSQGNYKISRSKDFSTPSTAVVLQPWTPSKALNTGNGVKNTLQVIVRNGTLLFYANGVFLGQAYQDITYTSGKIAFLATTTSGDTSADVRYSNLKVYTQ